MFRRFARFAAFELDLRTGQLRREGKPIELQPQPARVLTLLVSRAGEIVTRQELAQQVWGSETFVNYEQGLNFAVRQIRVALEDDADHPQFVETVPKRGYRFIGALKQPAEIEEPPSALPTDADKSPTGTTSEPRPARGFQRWVASAGVAIVLAGVAVSSLRYLFWGDAPSPLAAIRSIVVLPLVNLSSDPAHVRDDL